jgi:hypothetical protein
MRWWVPVGLSLLALGCRPAKSAESASTWRESPERLVEEVARIRGLADVRKTPIVFDEPAEFAKALETKSRLDAIGPTASDRNAFFTAFDFPPPNALRGSSFDEVVGEQIIAFYDSHSHSVHVRRDRVGRDDDEERMVLAHEIAHSLQEQHLRVPDLKSMTEADTRLAAMAVLEGDAMLVMLGHTAFRRRIPLNRALSRAAVMVGEDALRQYTRASKADRALASAPPLLRERLTFPYMHGLTFIGDIWRAGGFALVNRVYEAPPTTTEQVLHPEKYLAGEGAVPVAFPPAPTGYQAIASGRVGELQMRVILERCMSAVDARQAAAGWGGDAFSIVLSQKDDAALLWSTTWDSENEAKEFHSALERYVSCTRQRAQTHVMPLDDVIRAEGRHVALLRGLPKAVADPLMAGLLALPGAAPPRVAPLGPVTIPPRKQRVATRPPYVSAGIYVNERLGIMARVPPGAAVEMPTPVGVTFTVQEPPAIAGIQLSDELVIDETVDEIHGTLAAALQKAIGKHELDYVGGRAIQLPALGGAIDRSWQVRNTTAGMRAIVVPICNRTGSLVIWEIWTDPTSADLLQRWLATVRPTAWREPPVCAELDP